MNSHGAARRRPPAPAVLLCLAFVSCFDPPVREDLQLRFLTNGAVVVTGTVQISTDPPGRNAALARRLAETRRALLEGSDAWAERFASAKPAAERFGWEKRLGDLQSASRSAVIFEPTGLETIFGDTSVVTTYKVDKETGRAELTLVPGPAGRATRRQRQDMERTLEEWSTAIAEYLEAGSDLYAHLERQPDRARICLALLFADLLEENQLKDLDEPTEEEGERIERLQEAMRGVTAVLLVPQKAEYSPDEVSRLVFDPFPARLTVKLPGAPLEVEGFQRGEDGALAVAGLGLWEALGNLEGRWLAPDPVLFYVANSRGGKARTVDLDALLQKPRQALSLHQLPAVEEVRQAIEEQLRPAPLYRVSWRVQPDDESEFRWDEREGVP